MKGFFDMHCHTLYGVDDGAGDFSTSLAMLDIAYADGIRNICFTPHCNPYNEYPDPDAINESFRAISDFVSSNGLDMKLRLGSEIMYYSDFAGDIEKGVCHSLCGGKYVLFEFYYGAEFSEIFDAAERAYSLGYKPVIAHAERYDCILDKPSNLISLADRGILLQFNASLFDTGAKHPFFRQMKRKKLRNTVMVNRLPCIVSTDAHGVEKRPPRISFAYDELLRKTNSSYADTVFFEIPSEIFNDTSY